MKRKRLSITIEADSDLELADKLETAARQIRTKAQGGNCKLTAVMKRRGLFDRAVADAVGTTIQAVYYWRRGLRLPSIATLDRLKAFLNCPADEMGFDEDAIRKRGF